MIATTITALVAIRKQVIEDIYQITGLERHHARRDGRAEKRSARSS